MKQVVFANEVLLCLGSAKKEILWLEYYAATHSGTS